MPQTRRLYDTEIAEAIRLHVWQQLEDSLGLHHSGIGSQLPLDGGDLDDRLPAVQVVFIGADGVKVRSRESWEGVYRFEVNYLRAMSDGEATEDVARGAASTIAKLFLQDADWKIPTLTKVAGCTFRAVYPTAVEVIDDDDLLKDGIIRAVCFLTVEADSFLYTP